MRNPIRFLLMAMLVLPTFGCTPFQGQAVGDLRLDEPWARATPPGTSVAGGFITIRNLGDQDDRLVSVQTSASERVEIHEVRDDDGVMRMRPLPDGLPIPAGASVSLQPGGFHLMFIEPRRPFAGGDVVMATLVFERSGPAEVAFQVRGAGARAPAGGHGHH